jgi:mannose-6-phosphate isomerase class I
MWDKVGTKNWHRPLLLREDNFTAPERTPWGGRRIVERLKARSGIRVDGPVGESWELSVEPDFPSRLAEGPPLDEILRTDPALLGRERANGSTALLVKLVDAADDLSLQIHPHEDDAELGTDESGKPEAWYIIDAEPGAGLYLGFREGVTREDVRRSLAEGGRVDALMSFVRVSPGDLFLIEPGTPHAIGKGVLLLEPQRVAPGKRGITYRYWDWNRRYDATGRPDPSGEPRDLHATRALDVTQWEAPRGDALVDLISYRAKPAATNEQATLETLASPAGPLRSDTFILRRLAGSGRVELPAEDRLRAITALEGELVLGEGNARLTLCHGQTAALPATLAPLPVELRAAHAMLCTLA